jgi:hypothetical protein
MATKKVKPDTYMWLCPNCKSWNLLKNEQCDSCGAVLTDIQVYGVRVKDGLTSEELNFFEGSVPVIIRELQAIRSVLEIIVNRLEGHK